MNESIQSTSGSSAYVRHAAPARSRAPKNRGAELQHRAIAHHRDVHDSHAPLHRPQRLRRAETPPGAGTHLLPTRDAGRRQDRRRHHLLHLRMVLPRQGTDRQIQTQTRMHHGTRAPVLKPHNLRTSGICARYRPNRHGFLRLPA